MYPIPVVLIGNNERELPPIRRELLNLGIDLKKEFRTITELLPHRAEFQSEMHLFLFHLDSMEGLAEVRRLNGSFLGNPIMVLHGGGNDSDALIASMRAGAAQVVLLPLDNADFNAALHCIGLQFGRHSSASRVILVSGVSGGCGATTLASNLAYEVAHLHDQQTILGEMGLHMGMLVAYLAVEPKYTLYDLASYEMELDVSVVESALTRFSEKLHILAGPERPIAPTPQLASRMASIIEYLRVLATVVVLDVPCTFDDSYFEILAGANHVVLVGEQRIPSIRNFQVVLKTLGSRLSPNQIHLVLNRYDANLAGFTVEDMMKLLKVSQVLTISPDAARLAAALNQGKPLRLAASNSPFLSDMQKLIQVVLDLKQTKARQAAPTFIGRFLNPFGKS